MMFIQLLIYDQKKVFSWRITSRNMMC